MTPCEKIRDKLVAYLRGDDVAPLSRKVIEEHLEVCEACRAEHQAFMHTDRMLDAVRLEEPPALPEDTLPRILSRAKARVADAHATALRRYRIFAAVAAACLLIAVSLLYYSLSRLGEVRPATPATAEVRVEGKNLNIQVISGRLELKTPEGIRLLGRGQRESLALAPKIAEGKPKLAEEKPKIAEGQPKIALAPKIAEAKPKSERGTMSGDRKPEGLLKKRATDLEQLAWGTYYEGKYKTAAELFQKALSLRAREKKVPKKTLALLRSGIAWCRYWQKQYDRALSDFEEALRLVPDLTDARRGLGYCLFRKGSLKKARKELQSVAAAQPKWVDIWVTMGWCEYRLGDYDRAVAQFLEAQKLNPFLVEPAIGLGWCYYRMQEGEKAKAAFARVLHLYPEYASSSDFQSIAEKNRDWLHLYLAVGWSYYYKMKYDQARSVFSSLLRKVQKEDNKPLAANTRSGLGWTYFQMGQSKKAEEQFRLALTIAPTDSNALMGLEICQRVPGSPR
jgi:tetratricopeptide (TPR) repeat protein